MDEVINMDNDLGLEIDIPESKIIRILGIRIRIHKPVFPSKSRWTARMLTGFGLMGTLLLASLGGLALIADTYVLTSQVYPKVSLWMEIGRYVTALLFIVIGAGGSFYVHEVFEFNFREGV